MSVLNFDKVGRPLAIVDGGTLKGKTVYVATEEEREGLKRKFKEIDLPVGSKFKLIPNTKKEREILYICGPSGSGKSTFTANYLTEYKKKYPDSFKKFFWIFSLGCFERRERKKDF